MLKSILQTGRASILQPLIKTEICLAQQTRNTFVLKRRWEPRLTTKGAEPKGLKARNFVYDFIEDGDVIKKPDISIILTDYVDGVGFRGDLVKMRPKKAYRSLLAGLAVYDTPENRMKYDTEARLKEERQSPYIQRTIDVFGRKVVAICMNKFKPWVIEPRHIRVSMRKAGLYVMNDSQIELPKTPIHGPDLTKEGKDFYVTITINMKDKATVRCKLHHVTLDPKKRIPCIQNWWELESELLLPDEEGQRMLQASEKSKASEKGSNDSQTSK
ncbi:39S ribosomal protein L9, mitochondrial [Contarinia nasturtii]|uniref:39S ribosomal protein L9, mitochondrial n=1 Tax=Contarinia nasturtii TaxID=265458 RepID=UPI0012D42C24|nr:39S ribosomal protein L9, mitochondrial [Contarinia nasturtii]